MPEKKHDQNKVKQKVYFDKKYKTKPKEIKAGDKSVNPAKEDNDSPTV